MPKPTDVRPGRGRALLPADQDPDAAQVRPRDHDRGDLRARQDDGRGSPGPPRRRLGRDAALASSGSGPATLSYEERHQALRAALPCGSPRPGLASHVPARPPDRGRPPLPRATSCPACTRRLQRRASGRTRAGPLAGRPGLLLGLRPGAARRLRRAPRRADLSRPITTELHELTTCRALSALPRRTRPTSRSRAGIPRTSWSCPGLRRIPAWHLVGGKDPIDPSELTGTEPDDGYPVLLRDWIRRDGLKCLKVKLRGDDAAWDYDRLLEGRPDRRRGRRRLADRRLQLHGPRPAYVNAILDRLIDGAPAALRDAPLRRAAVPLRPGGASDRRPQRLGAEAAVHGRERPRLALRPARPRAGLDGRGAEDLQDPDRGLCSASAGPRPTA